MKKFKVPVLDLLGNKLKDVLGNKLKSLKANFDNALGDSQEKSLTPSLINGYSHFHYQIPTSLLFVGTTLVGILIGSSAVLAETFVLNGNKALNTNEKFGLIDGHPRMSIWDHNLNDPDQNFDRQTGNKGGQLLVHRRTGKCLNAYRRWNGAEINVYPCNANDADQNFQISAFNTGEVQIKLANTNFCVDSPTRNNGGKVTLWQCIGNANQLFKINGSTTVINPPSGYYRDLASLSNDQWDQYSGDSTRFDPNPQWDLDQNRKLVDERSKTPASISQIYTDLSLTIFGVRRPMNSGYLYDQSYFKGYGKWHAGLDIDAPMVKGIGVPVKAVIGGTRWMIQNISGNYFMGVKGDDGKLWIYGHLGSLNGTSGRIEAGQVVGTTGSLNHLHLEVQNNKDKYEQTLGAHSNQQFVRDVTFSPLQAFWQVKNR